MNKTSFETLKKELDNLLILSTQYSIREEFKSLKTKLGNTGASKRAADIIDGLVNIG